MEGRIEVSSSTEAPTGSEFKFYLPYKPVPSEVTKSDPTIKWADLSKTLKGKRLLVAEDNLLSQKLMTAMLNRLGCISVIAKDGDDAVATFTDEGPWDIILMDCQMPQCDGFDATKKIKEVERAMGLESTPIISLTANVLEMDKVKSFDAGMVDHLPKPVTMKDLADKLSLWVRIRQTSNDPAFTQSQLRKTLGTAISSTEQPSSRVKESEVEFQYQALLDLKHKSDFKALLNRVGLNLSEHCTFNEKRMVLNYLKYLLGSGSKQLPSHKLSHLV